MFAALTNIVMLAITAWSPNPTGTRAMKVVGFSTIFGLILLIVNVILFPIDVDSSTMSMLTVVNQQLLLDSIQR